MDELVAELAKVYPDEASARALLRTVGFPDRLRGRSTTPREFWRRIIDAAEHGALKGKWEIACAASRNYPENPVFRRLCDPGGPTTIEDYRTAMASVHGQMSLVGSTMRASRPAKIDEIYIPQRAAVDLSSFVNPERLPDLKHALTQLKSPGSERDVELPRAVGLSWTFEGRRGSVVLGEPGAGKTTFFRKLICDLASGDAAASVLGLPERVLPVYAPLRKLVGSHLDSLLEAELTGFPLEVPSKFARSLLNRENLLILLDGLDEVHGESNRMRVLDRISKIQRLRPTHKFLITSRYAGYSRKVRERMVAVLSFGELHLHSFSDDEVETFVRRFFTFAENAHHAGSQRRAAAKSEALLTEIRPNQQGHQRSWFHELTGNPLLLTIVCLVHRGGTLPRGHIELLEQCVRGMLGRWREGQDLQTPELDLVTVLADIFADKGPATSLVQRAGLSKENTPEFETAVEFWDDVAHKAKAGMLRGKMLPVVEEALLDYKYNDDLHYYHRMLTAPPAIGGENVESLVDCAQLLLQPLAHWMHAEPERRQAPESSLQEPLRMAGERHDIDVDPRRFLESIYEESGVVTKFGKSEYGFSHLVLQEYFTAKEIHALGAKDARIIDQLAQSLGSRWWDGVLILALGLETRYSGDTLFDRLMRRLLESERFVRHWNSGRLGSFVHGARERRPEVFLEFLRLSRGREGSEKVQIALLQILNRNWPEEIVALAADLESHPSADVRNWAKEWRRRRAANNTTNTGIDFIRIPGGSFAMGSVEDEDGRQFREGPRHEVVLSDFWIARGLVTNEQYAVYLMATPDARRPRRWDDRRYNQPDQPVVGISCADVAGYCQWAGLSLPTEAQWEYACRAGSTTRFYSGDTEGDLARVGWYDGNSEGRLHPTAMKEPNGYGLYDMHGNTWELCQDAFGSYDVDVRKADGLRHPPDTISFRVLRGGGWRSSPSLARSASRISRVETHVGDDVGFRPVFTPNPPETSNY